MTRRLASGALKFKPLDRCRVMGVVNVTPDSFSDPGVYEESDVAIRAGLAMVANGADIIDVGGESTRPGSSRVDVAEERRRVVPVIAELANAGIVTSVDTTRASVAAAALDVGAAMVNDISCAAELDVAEVVAGRDVPYVLVHNRLPAEPPLAAGSPEQAVDAVVRRLEQRMDLLLSLGVDEDQIIVDPGIGFGKDATTDLYLLANIQRLHSLGRPVIVSASRKAFLGQLLAAEGGSPRPVDARDDATQATTALLALAGVWAVRVHAVVPAVDVVRVVAAWCRSALAVSGQESTAT